jgi:hypothetical protein
VIPDADEAVASPVTVVREVSQARRVLDLVPEVPTPVWGRDDLGTGDMWNSNSLTAWLLSCSGHDPAAPGLQPPAGGRAPGWSAGLVVAARANPAAAAH